jgi:hypothetical protein
MDQDLLQDLWKQVLDSTESDENQLSLVNIEDFYQRVVGGKPRVRTKKTAPAIVYSPVTAKPMDGFDTDYSEEGISLRKRERPEFETYSGTDSAMCPSDDSFNSRNGYNLRNPKSIKFLENEENYPGETNTDRIVSKKRAFGTGIDKFDIPQSSPPLRGLEKDLNDCQEAMNNLISMGYVVESCIDGQWYQPDHWKLESVLAMELLELSRSSSAKKLERLLSSGLVDY